MATATDRELCYFSIGELVDGYERRRFSPLEVTEAFLRRIEQLDPALRSYITLLPEAARTAAIESEHRHAIGRAVGPLDGIPIGVKDLFDTAGILTTANSRQYANRIPGTDASVIRRLRDGRAVLLGKHNMYEFASGSAALDSLSPPAHNPWNVDLVPGGSSSGSAAAVAAGLCAAAMGSDTGGSIRGPASYCGIVGLKPSRGLVSRHGVIPLSWTLDQVGPMTRNVEDAALLLQVVAGYDPLDPASTRVPIPDYRAGLTLGLRDVRIGAPIAFIEAAPDLSPETMTAYRAALSVFEGLGANVVSVEIPENAYVNAVQTTILVAEAFGFHESNARVSPDKFGRDFYARLLEGALVTAADYIHAQRGRALISRAVASLMREVDLLVLPTTPHPAWSFAQEREVRSSKRTSFTRRFNITGQPAISIPCGFTSNGLPIGLQIAGRLHEDAFVLAAAFAYEQQCKWSDRRPALPH